PPGSPSLVFFFDRQKKGKDENSSLVQWRKAVTTGTRWRRWCLVRAGSCSATARPAAASSSGTRAVRRRNPSSRWSEWGLSDGEMGSSLTPYKFNTGGGGDDLHGSMEVLVISSPKGNGLLFPKVWNRS
ncbi:unnamed protein product, partial [Musa acuminata var. zebrina]